MKLLTRGRLIAAVGIVAFGVVLVARGMNSGHPARVGVPNDWSHRHVVFSKPATVLQAQRLQAEPRYWHQLLTRNAVPRMGAPAERKGFGPHEPKGFPKRKVDPNSSLGRDWAVSLGPGASTGNATYPQFPAKFTYDVSQASINCTDYAVFPTNVPGETGTSTASPGQATIVAYSFLYTGPGGTGICNIGTNEPVVYWAYNTNAVGDTTGVVSGSPVISGDGTKIAFVESNPSGSVLHLLRYLPFEGFSFAAAPKNQLTSGDWTACPPAQSCMISLTFSTSTAVNSSPFYNFALDELYLGDDSGVLHKFTGVFNGTPTEVTSGWPITVHAGAALTPPVFDSVTNNLFVGDSTGILSFVKDTGSTTGACATGVPPCLGSTTVLATSGGLPVIDPPTLDPTTGKVFVFVGSDSGADTGVVGGAYVVQTNVDLTGVVRVNVGTDGGTNGAPLHSGAFDNTYFNSSPGSIAGFMWVCGKGSTDVPTLRRIAFSADGTATSASPSVLLTVGSTTGAAGQCSPVTEIFNPAAGPSPGTPTDFIFFSVQSGDLPTSGIGPFIVPTNCPGTGCVMSANVTTGGSIIMTLSGSLGELGGTSGIIIDNVGTDPQEANIYFTRLAQTALSSCGGAGATMVGCAVKLTQAGLN
jgi:hypothetical protein